MGEGELKPRQSTAKTSNKRKHGSPRNGEKLCGAGVWGWCEVGRGWLKRGTEAELERLKAFVPNSQHTESPWKAVSEDIARPGLGNRDSCRPLVFPGRMPCGFSGLLSLWGNWKKMFHCYVSLASWTHWLLHTPARKASGDSPSAHGLAPDPFSWFPGPFSVAGLPPPTPPSGMRA